MALLVCQDCGGQVSDAAASCPACGRPTGAPTSGSCEHCGTAEPVTGSGLHGPLEIATVVAWAAGGLVVGLLIYWSLSSRPWCPACRQRPNGAVNGTTLAVLLVLGLFVDWMVLRWLMLAANPTPSTY